MKSHKAADAMTFHEAAELFPLLEGEEFEEFKEDLRKNGQREPVALLDGLVLDGRNRCRACLALGMAPRTRELPPYTDPVAYVLSVNLHRRHLEKGQRGMCSARAKALREKLVAQARARQREAAARAGKASGSSRRGETNVPAPVPERSSGDVRDEIGKLFGVSGRSVDLTTKVLNKAEPEVIKAVEEGRLGVSVAAVIADLPPEAQRREAAAPRPRSAYRRQAAASAAGAAPAPTEAPAAPAPGVASAPGATSAPARPAGKRLGRLVAAAARLADTVGPLDDEAGRARARAGVAAEVAKVSVGWSPGERKGRARELRQLGIVLGWVAEELDAAVVAKEPGSRRPDLFDWAERQGAGA